MLDRKALFGVGLLLVSVLAGRSTAAGRPGNETLALPVTYQLFGPVQADGKEENTYGTTYVFIGDALTASTKWFPFSQGLPPVQSAVWKHEWTPNDIGTSVRLVHMDNGPANITPIAEVQSDGSMTPVVESIDFTKVMNELIAAKVDKHLGFQVKDDGASSSSIYESRLEVVFTIAR